MSVRKKVEVSCVSCDKGHHIPKVVRKRLGVLLNEDHEIDEIYKKLSYVFYPEASNSVWSKNGIIRQINRSSEYILDRYFIKTEKDSSTNFCSYTKDESPANVEETQVNPPSNSINCSKNEVEPSGNIEGRDDDLSSNSDSCSNNEAEPPVNVGKTKVNPRSSSINCPKHKVDPPRNIEGTEDDLSSNSDSCSNNEAEPPVNVGKTKVNPPSSSVNSPKNKVDPPRNTKGTEDDLSSNSDSYSNNEAGPPVNVEKTKVNPASSSINCSKNEVEPPWNIEGTEDDLSSNSGSCSNNEAGPSVNEEGTKVDSLSNLINCSNCEPSRNLKSPNLKETKVHHSFKPNVCNSGILDISDATHIVNISASTSYTNDEEHTRTIGSGDLVNESDNSSQNKKSQVKGYGIIEQLKSKIRKKLSASFDSEIARKRNHRQTIYYNVDNHSLHSEGNSSDNSTAIETLNSTTRVNIDHNDPEISPSKHLRLDGSKESNLSEDSLSHVQRKSPKKKKSSKQMKFDESHNDFNFDTNTEKPDSKLVHVRDMVEDVDVDPLYTSDINSEDDLFLVQCPCDINPNDLTGKAISLFGSSSLSITINEKVEKYDCVAVKSDSLLNLLLPSGDHSGIKLGMYPSSGKIILSQGAEGGRVCLPGGSAAESLQGERFRQQLSHGRPLAESTLLSREAADLPSDNPELPQDELHGRPLAESTLLPGEAADVRSDLPQDEPYDDDHMRDDGCLTSFTESIEYSPVIKKKKKKHKGDDHMRDDEYLTSFTESIEDLQVAKKKKKKHKGDEYTADDECFTTFTEPCEVVDTKKRKKKKKKHKGDKYSMNDECPSTFADSIEDTVSKKRKKKKKHKGDEYSLVDECPTSFTDSIEDTVIKKRKKKKKHKDNERSIDDGCLTSLTESTEDHVTKKRKKKKKHSGAEQMEDDEHLTSFTEPIEDPINKQKKKKGHEGDVQTLESVSSFTVNSENSGPVRIKQDPELNIAFEIGSHVDDPSCWSED